MNRYKEQQAGDAVFWLSHDRGRPRLKPAILALALAGGLLGELFLDQKIELHHGQVCLRYEVFTFGYQRQTRWEAPSPPKDKVSAELFREILADQSADMGSWLSAIAPIAVDRVTERLKDDELLVPIEARRAGLLRWATRERTHTPVGETADQVWAVLSTRLLRGEHGPDAQRDVDAFVVGIATVTGLLDHLLLGARRNAFSKAHRLVADLPSDLAQLVAQVETSIAKSALIPKG